VKYNYYTSESDLPFSTAFIIRFPDDRVDGTIGSVKPRHGWLHECYQFVFKKVRFLLRK